jgi:N-acetylglucosaminyldiphosphoundecaprenol N-acetyl-beta-D-mannosaminyltransferase
MTDRVEILGIPFDKITLAEAVKLLSGKLGEPRRERPFLVATPNPEMLLEARKNKAFKDVLLKSDLNIPDGTGIILASGFMKSPLPERVTGTDLMQELCLKAPRKTRIFLLGAAPGVAEKVRKHFESKSEANVVGTFSGTADEREDKDLQKIINEASPDLLFVAFGAPKQELWLSRNLPHLKTVKVAMGVGGAFDFIAGVRKRAPGWLRKAGLEWLFRLFQQPKRINRIINAAIVFPLVFLFSGHKK